MTGQSEVEWFDIVDAEDRVINRAPRDVVHAEKHLHRAVHIWIFNSQNELLIHRRTAEKEDEPLKWTSSAAGHVSSGEVYETAASRELQEELSLHTELSVWHKIFSGPDIGYEHTVLFAGQTDVAPEPDQREILEFRYASMQELLEWLAADPAELSNPFREFLRWYEAMPDKPSL